MFQIESHYMSIVENGGTHEEETLSHPSLHQNHRPALRCEREVLLQYSGVRSSDKMRWRKGKFGE